MEYNKFQYEENTKRTLFLLKTSLREVMITFYPILPLISPYMLCHCVVYVMKLSWNVHEFKELCVNYLIFSRSEDKELKELKKNSNYKLV